MTIRTASLFALIGTVLAAATATVHFILYFLNSLNGLVASAAVLDALVQAIVWITLAIFFVVFYRKQS